MKRTPTRITVQVYGRLLRVSSANRQPEPPSRLGLSREVILRAARWLLDSGGPAAVSMRRVADELSIGTMTLYGYFRTKDELLDALLEVAAPTVTKPPAEGEWRERLRELMVTLHDALVSHPGFVELRRERPLITPAALELSETAMSILTEAGFSGRAAARAYRALFIFTFGSVAFAHPDRGPRDRRATRDALRRLDPDFFPTLLAHAGEVETSMGDPTIFHAGLDAVLRGLQPDA